VCTDVPLLKSAFFLWYVYLVRCVTVLHTRAILLEERKREMQNKLGYVRNQELDTQKEKCVYEHTKS